MPMKSPLRITTWNCARKNRAKILPAVSSFAADLVVLQEIAKPATPDPSGVWVGEDPKQGLSVVSCKGAPIDLAPEYDPALRYALPIQVGGSRPFQLLGIWMLSKPIHYVPNLVAILERYRAFIGRAPTIVTGDFNANPGFDRHHPRHRFSSIDGRMCELGLFSAYHTFTREPHGQEKQPTFFMQYKEAKPYHIDYLYLPEAWRRNLRSVQVGSYADYAGQSDHRPLTANFRF